MQSTRILVCLPCTVALSVLLMLATRNRVSSSSYSTSRVFRLSSKLESLVPLTLSEYLPVFILVTLNLCSLCIFCLPNTDSDNDTKMSSDPKDPKDPKPPAEKMASVTVIANPLAKDKVLLFQSGATSNGLRVVPQSLVDFVPKGAFGPKDATSVVRPLTQPGQLVSMVFKDTINVYGTTGKDQKDYQLELVSPVQAPLNNNEYQPISGALAGCSNRLEGSKERAWLYYIWYPLKLFPLHRLYI